VFEVREKVGEWYRVDFMSKVGVLVTGYIHEMFVEEDRGAGEEPAPTGKRRAFSLSVCGGYALPVFYLAMDEWGFGADGFEGNARGLFRAPGPEFSISGEYFFSPAYSAGLHSKAVELRSKDYPDPTVVPDTENEIFLIMVGVHGKRVFNSRGTPSPYVLLGTGLAFAVPPIIPHFDETGTFYVVERIDTRPYVVFGGGLDYSVSSRVSLFGELACNLLLWRGADLHWQGHPSRESWELHDEYFFFDVAGGVRIGLGAQ
jgi:hypothetical protein